MTKRKRFCAECGKTDVPLHDNFCQECYWKHNSLGELSIERMKISYCLECGSVKLTSGWTGQNYQHEIPEIIAFAQIKRIDADSEVIIDVKSISSINWNDPNPEFKITYLLTSNLILEFDTHEEHHDLTIKLEGASCPTCMKKRMGSRDVRVQFRAKNRSITQAEQDKATTLAFTHVSEMVYESPEAYINDIIKEYGGLDFYFGNNAVAEKFIESIKRQFPGHYEKNYKLITEDKDEKQIYNTTHLFRLPEVKLSDLVEVEGELYFVHYLSKNGVHIQSLIDGERTIIKKWEDLKPLDPPPIIIKKMVVSEDINANSYQFMDLESYETEEVAMDRFPDKLPVGEEISVLEWEGKYYQIPEIFQPKEDQVRQ